MSLNLAGAILRTPTETVRPPALGRGAMRLLALTGRLRRAVIPATTQSRQLSAAVLRDTGLNADQIGQGPIWGHGGIMWRP
jgi:hypothetical protein